MDQAGGPEALEKRRFKLDAISYNSLISGFSTAHLWKEALHVLERFEDGDVTAWSDFVNGILP
jgi:pentatricopeptide repeat protein